MRGVWVGRSVSREVCGGRSVCRKVCDVCSTTEVEDLVIERVDTRGTVADEMSRLSTCSNSLTGMVQVSSRKLEFSTLSLKSSSVTSNNSDISTSGCVYVYACNHGNE